MKKIWFMSLILFGFHAHYIIGMENDGKFKKPVGLPKTLRHKQLQTPPETGLRKLYQTHKKQKKSATRKRPRQLTCNETLPESPIKKGGHNKPSAGQRRRLKRAKCFSTQEMKDWLESGSTK